jgi:hypothetical protein
MSRIQKMQDRVGAVPDGFWGPKSIAACQRYLRSLMPSPNPWPGQSQAELTRFYGAPGENLTTIDVTGLGVQFDGKGVSRITCNVHCANSLLRVLQALAKSEWAWILREYAGVYVNRPMRGGKLPSLHARGAAIDLWPDHNGLWTHWPARATMPLEVMEIFALEGWLPAGAFWGRDAMHFQATR